MMSTWDLCFDGNPPSPSVNNSASALLLDSLTALHRYLPSNDQTDEDQLTVDAFSCDHFRMYEFKVRKCARGRSHDWTECPYAHPGEKARRRDPRKYNYSGTACPDFRKGGGCVKGDSCEFAHGVFECWLHPERYRTQPCKDGSGCRRRVCFFAHTPQQLRVLPPPVSPPSGSPPMSPNSPRVGLSDVIASMRGLQLMKTRVGPPTMHGPGLVRSIPASSPTWVSRNIWEEEEPAMMERVESGRDIRARMYAKLSKEYSSGEGAPDVGWVAELVK